MDDVLVVGGGPAGLASAIHAAKRGMSVTVVDARTGPLDKACGEGLMPGAWREIHDLGAQIQRSHPFDGIRYIAGSQLAEGRFRKGPGHGVRRLELHRALSDRADALGVKRVTQRVGNIELQPDHVRVDRRQARWLVAADGLRSPIRRQLGLERRSYWPRRYGVRQHFAIRPWSQHVEVHWSDVAEAYVTPVDDELIGVAILFGESARRLCATPGPPFDRLIEEFPQLRERLHSPASRPRGAGPFAQKSRRRVMGRVLLVGDAAGYLDPLTGEGIKLGLLTARAAIDAIERGQPQAYEQSWRRIYRTYATLTGGLLMATRWKWSRRCVVPIAKILPGVMPAIMGMLAA